MEGPELAILAENVEKYEKAVGKRLDVGALPAVPPLPVRGQQADQQAQQPRSNSAFRIHGADVQLTFNHAEWRSQDQETEAWFAQHGLHLVARFQTWALEVLPTKFQTTIQHTSLTLEESCHAAGDTKRVHLHAQLTFAQRIDRTSVADFVFEGVRPHVVPWLWYYSCSL